MSNYNFKLQKLLDIRSDKEEESKKIFKEAQNEKLKVEKNLSNLKENYNKYKKAAAHESVTERKIRYVYLSNMIYNIKETEEELKNKEKILEDKRQELKQRQIERKTVETLKEKEKEVFIKEENLKEQRMNDEFALYSFIRNIERR
jgi:flagellar FliJ protein